jgi:hypothetical protein
MTTKEQNQAYFDFVMHKMIEQGRPSLSVMIHGTRVCAYRGENGTKCALGFIIPDDLYSEEIEGKSLRDESVNQLKCFDGKDFVLLTTMQMAHDRASEDEKHFMDRFRNFMRSVANNFGLDDYSTYLPATTVYDEY